MVRKSLFFFTLCLAIFLLNFPAYSQTGKKSGHVLCFSGSEDLFVEYYVLNELSKDNKKLKLNFRGAPLYIILDELKFRKISIKPVLDVKMGKDSLFVAGLHFFNKETKEELICYFSYCCYMTVEDFKKNPHCLVCMEIVSAEYWNPENNLYEVIGNAQGLINIFMLLPEGPKKDYVVIKSKFCKGEKRIPIKKYRKLLEKYRKKIKFSKDKNCSDYLYDYIEDMDFINSMNYDFVGVF